MPGQGSGGRACDAMTGNAFGQAIRQCRPSDLDGVTQLEESSFPDPYDRAAFAYLLGLEPEGFLVAEECGRIVGYIVSSTRYGYGLVLSIAVSVGHRRKGIGSDLKLLFPSGSMWQVHAMKESAVPEYVKL